MNATINNKHIDTDEAMRLWQHGNDSGDGFAVGED